MAARPVVFATFSDLIDGIFRLALSDYHEPVNIGNPREITILDFANKILEITGAKSQIITEPLPVNDPKVRQPNISRARNSSTGSQRLVSSPEFGRPSSFLKKSWKSRRPDPSSETSSDISIRAEPSSKTPGRTHPNVLGLFWVSYKLRELDQFSRF
jgi:hypothetical protein